MMKSFFKKLAFVMALAMVVSMAAPAGSALAAGLSVAYQNGGAVSELNVKAGAEQDLKFLGAPKNWKDLGFAWTSSNEAVATVDQTGLVTAVADGTATITITVGDLSGSVTVNVGEAKAYDVTLGNADNKAMTAADLKEGASLDLNFYGVKDWNKDNYTVAWSVSGDAANVDKNGVVTAVKAGKAVVTASIVNNLTGVAHKVAPVEVTVAGSVDPNSFTVAQKDADKFVLTFAEAKTAEAITDGLEIAVKIGDKNYPISFENVTVDGNTVTVTTYSQFENEEIYNLTFAGKSVEYTILLGDIASVAVDYYTGKNKDNKFAFVAEEEENDYVTLVPVLYDKYGNDITAKYDLADFEFYYEISSNVAATPQFNDTFTFGAAGVANVDVTAEWWTEDGETKTVTGKSAFVVEKRGNIVLTLEKAGIGTSLNWLPSDTAFTYENSPREDFRLDPNSDVWNCWGGWFVKTSFDYREDRDPVYTAVFKDNRGNLVTSNDNTYEYGTFSYESTNINVVSIIADGSVTFEGTGKANILVYFEPADGTTSKKLVASTLITVTPELVPTTFKVLNTSATTANNVIDEDLNDVKYEVQFYDQYGNVYDQRTGDIASALQIELRTEDAKLHNNILDTNAVFSWQSWNNAYGVVIDGSAFDLGIPGESKNYSAKTYNYKIYLNDTDVASTVKTSAAAFKITVKDTSKEKTTLAKFIAGQDISGEKYQFNIAIRGNSSMDVAVKDIIGYSNTNAQVVEKNTSATYNGATRIDVTYNSSANLPIAKVPASMFVDNTDNDITTGEVGYVYYKVSYPKKTTIAGKTENNDAWSATPILGALDFTLNKLSVTHYFKDDNTNEEFPVYFTADGKLHKDQYTVIQDGSDNVITVSTFDPAATGYIYYGKYEGETGYTPKPISYVKGDETFKYAGNGNYSATFATVNKDGNKLNTLKTSTITVTNSQSQMKYLGLNPEFNGVTEMTLTAGMSDAELLLLIKEQLRFSYEELFLGDYYDGADAWSFSEIDFNRAKSVIEPKTGMVNISKVAFDVKLDNPGETVKHTIIVNVGARIKEK